KPRGIYLKSRLGIERKWALATTNAADTMVTALGAQKLRLTKEGELKQAQAAEAQIVEISEDPRILNARELPKRLSKDGRSRVACIVRRQGDDIEVLVRFDSAGKISLKSPVENIREKTGKAGEKGGTSANTLGEFVGASNFESDPVVVFDETVESGKIVFEEVAGFEIKKRVSVSDKEGVQFSLMKGTNNGYLGMNEILPPLSEPATFRLTCEYLIPKSNKMISGISARHGNSSQGANFKDFLDQVGQWTIGITEGVSASPDGLLRLHLRGVPFGDYPKAIGDSFLIRSLKIELLKTSASIVESYGSNGEVTSETKAKASQKLLVSNGTLISN
ncbi:hypothetical protein N9A63_04710, partial [Akkermansiaceae bacterium]|nr:hypothetical protein [Akkermansiaceae bacterium]